MRKLILLLALFLTASTRPACLPDNQDRYFMGYGSTGQCIYQDMDSDIIYEGK